MELDYSELHCGRKVRGTEQVESLEDNRFNDILTTQIHKNQNAWLLESTTSIQDGQHKSSEQQRAVYKTTPIAKEKADQE